MADSGQKTEQPTQRRLEKTRKDGRFAVSREFVSGVQFLAFVALLVAYAVQWAGAGRELMRTLLLAAFQTQLTREGFIHLLTGVVGPKLTPLLVAGMALTLVSIASHIAVTKMGFAPEKLAPDFTRLNPMPRLKGMPQQNLHSAMEAIFMLPIFILALWFIVRDNLNEYLRLPLYSVESGVARVAVSFESLFWKAAGLFLVFGCLDLLRQKRRYSSELRMSKQEIRDEFKESEGNPQIKMQIRRIRRDLLRRQMMKEVPKATAVVVNPTHFAVAIRYDMGSMSAPVCVAKGKNYLALRIKQIAIDHQVPIVENPPLAQSLYKSVDVGQEIPAHLFRAVAEILAYIYRLMNGRMPGEGSR
jgi:flagellar biosynthetic protein FlhB